MGGKRRELPVLSVLPVHLARWVIIGYIHGDDMLRLVSAGAVLLAVASTANAGGHYVEVWNPPEARIGQPAGKGNNPKAGKTALLARGMGKVAPRRVADPLAKASAGKHAQGSAVTRKATSPRFIDIPRILTPEGNVLQVGTGHMTVHVVR